MSSLEVSCCRYSQPAAKTQSPVLPAPCYGAGHLYLGAPGREAALRHVSIDMPCACVIYPHICSYSAISCPLGQRAVSACS
jgi:hypothetical protein